MKILFFGPGFHQYDSDISKEMEKSGCEITYVNYSSDPINTWPDESTKYDLIFCIKGNEYVYQYLRKYNSKKVKKINYQWDSISNLNYMNDLSEIFDEVYSFDRNDCDKYNLLFLPLFYTIDKKFEESKFRSVSFSGVEHSNRREILRRFDKILKDNKISFDFYLYVGIKKFLFRPLNDMVYTWLKPRPLAYSDFISSLENSEVVLDIVHPNQSGLTIRTIEALGLEKKIITNNEHILNYDFYKYGNVFVFQDNIEEDELVKFIEEPFKPLPNYIKRQYSIKGWVKKILEGQNGQ